MSARDPHKVARWLWQLLGYAWLDHAHGCRHHVVRVGRSFACHGHMIRWTVDKLAEQLLDGATHSRARAAFLDVACDTWRAEAARIHC